MIIENTSLMQQDKYIFHLYVFTTCFERDITHHQELQNCTHSDMVIIPREVRRDVVEEIKWRLARQYYARVGDVKLINNSSQLNIFRAIILPIFRSTRLRVTACSITHPRCCRPVTGRQHRGCIIPQAVTHSLVLLKMGKIIARNMLSWVELLIGRYCCI